MLAQSWPDIKRTFEDEGYTVIDIETSEASDKYNATLLANHEQYMQGRGYPQIAVVSGDEVVARFSGFAKAETIIEALNNEMNKAQFSASMAAYGASMAAYYNANSY